MEILPDLSSIEEALDYWADERALGDPVAAYVAGYLKDQGMSNKESRTRMGIDKTYKMTHLRRVGCRLSRTCLEVWLNNSGRIGLGHARAISSLPLDEREGALRDLLVNSKMGVRDLEALAQGRKPEEDVDILRLETNMSEAVGFPVKVRWDKSTRRGSLTLQLYSLDDLDEVGRRLGYMPESY
ncbi:hypothetical protein DOK_11701 [gamma proteobacterium BDW918]|nr:hypothetical protein DOK_11701 [gamma proteobacterium BDW918]